MEYKIFFEREFFVEFLLVTKNEKKAFYSLLSESFHCFFRLGIEICFLTSNESLYLLTTSCLLEIDFIEIHNIGVLTERCVKFQVYFEINSFFSQMLWGREGGGETDLFSS